MYNGNAGWVHMMMTIYNGTMVLLWAVFIAVTQYKINISMGASAFLKQVPVMPSTAGEIIAATIISFSILTICGFLYSHLTELSVGWRYIIFAVEIGSCIFLMRSINLFYDGIILLLVADFMYRYEGKNQLIIMLLSTAAIYVVISYNVSLLHMKVIPFELYMSYYNNAAQSMMIPLKNLVTYGNIVLFVIYIVVLLQDKRQENEQISQLNHQLTSANNKLFISNTQLDAANKKLRSYAMTIASLTETRERNRLAREIHDTLGHALTGIVAGLDACMVTIDIAPDATKKQLMKIRDAAQHGITDVRRSMHKLRPDDLEKLSLKEALEKMAWEFSGTGSTKATIIFDNFPENFREDQSEVVYRIVQEGMTNASRHGHASNVKIVLSGESDNLTIIISDDGIGCKNLKDGFGLHHMRERVGMLGGTINYWSEKGFVLEVVLPLNRG